MIRRWKAAVALYAAMGLVTFGLTADQSLRQQWAQDAACRTVAMEQPTIITECPRPSPAFAGLVGLVSAAVWPLAWSWAIAERVGLK